MMIHRLGLGIGAAWSSFGASSGLPCLSSGSSWAPFHPYLVAYRGRATVHVLSCAPFSAEGGVVNIPEERLSFSFSRSSGAGGQNVNKVNTKVEVRFLLDEADWLPDDVRDRLAEQQSSRLNKSGELVFVCQEHRTQNRNREEALRKVRSAIEAAMIEPKERNMRTGISEGTKEKRKQDKRQRGEVKRNRGKLRGSGDW